MPRATVRQQCRQALLEVLSIDLMTLAAVRTPSGQMVSSSSWSRRAASKSRILSSTGMAMPMLEEEELALLLARPIHLRKGELNN